MSSPGQRKHCMLKRLSIVLFLVFISGSVVFGWDFSKHNIPLEEIHSGGPPKDGIPALTDPKFVTNNKATFSDPDDRFLGFFENGEIKAYPFSVLEKVSSLPDQIDGETITVNFDKEEKTAWIESQRGEIVPSVQVYWFAWYAFYPNTNIFIFKK